MESGREAGVSLCFHRPEFRQKALEEGFMDCKAKDNSVLALETKYSQT